MKKERKGLIIVHTGNGKGKTTAAMGMALRGVGHGLKILMIQFIKGTWKYGELKAAHKLYPNFELIPMGKGFIGFKNGGGPAPKDRKAVYDAWEFSKESIGSNNYDMIIFDEINTALSYGMLDLDDVLQAIVTKPERLHVVLTGRNAHSKIIDIADLVTEMKEIKHPYKKGIKAQKGIEF